MAHHDLRIGKEPKRQHHAAEAEANYQRSSIAEVEPTSRIPAGQPTMWHNDRHSSWERQLTSMGMTAESKVETLFAEVEQTGWRVHEDNAQTVSTSEGGSRIGIAISVVVQSADPDVLERFLELHVPIDQNTDSSCFQGADDVGSVGTSVVVTQYSVASEGSGDLPKLVSQPVDFRRHECDKISAKEKNVGARGLQGSTSGPQERRIRCGAGVEI